MADPPAPASAEDIRGSYSEKGADQTNTTLLDHINQARTAVSNDPEQQKQFDTQQTEQLEQSGVLPELSVEFLKDNFNQADANHDNSVDKEELQQARDRTAEGSVERRMYDELLRNYDALRYEKADDAQQGITERDITNNQERTNRQRGTALEGNPNLSVDHLNQHFQQLDTSGDGAVDKDELQAARRNAAEGSQEQLIFDDLLSRYDSLRYEKPGDPQNGITRNDTGHFNDRTAHAEISKQEQQQIVDVLAKNPALLAAISNEDGTINPEKVRQAISAAGAAEAHNQPSGYTEAELTALRNMDKSFQRLAGDDGKLTTDELTAQAYDGDNFDHRQRMEGNGQLSAEQRAQLEAYLEQHPEFRKRVTDQQGNITKDTLRNAGMEIYHAGEHGAPSPYTEEEQRVLGMLNDSYNTLAGADGVIEQGSIDPADGADDAPQIQYEVKPGQGFDTIARDVFQQQFGRRPTIQEEIALSKYIAEMNNNDRNYSGGGLHPKQKIVIPDLTTQEARAAFDGNNFQAYIAQQHDALRTQRGQA